MANNTGFPKQVRWIRPGNVGQAKPQYRDETTDGKWQFCRANFPAARVAIREHSPGYVHFCFLLEDKGYEHIIDRNLTRDLQTERWFEDEAAA